MDIIEDFDVNENKPIECVIRDRSNPFEEFNDATFLNRFRLPKDTVLLILAEIMTFIHYREGFDRLYFVPPMLQLLITLHLFSSSCFQQTDGQIFGVQQYTEQSF